MDERTDVSCNAIPDIDKAISQPDRWDGAYRRVDTYLAALGVGCAMLRHRLAQQVMAGTGALLHEYPERHAAEAAMEELRNQIATWTGQFAATSDAEAFLQTRLALLLAKMPCRWNTVFMADTPVPEAFAAALRETLQSVPRFSPGRMELNPLELGLVPHLAEAALQTLEGTPWLRVIVASGSVACLFGILFYLTR